MRPRCRPLHVVPGPQLSPRWLALMAGHSIQATKLQGPSHHPEMLMGNIPVLQMKKGAQRGQEMSPGLHSRMQAGQEGHGV